VHRLTFFFNDPKQLFWTPFWLEDIVFDGDNDDEDEDDGDNDDEDEDDVDDDDNLKKGPP